MTLVVLRTAQQTANAIYQRNFFQVLRLPLGGLIW